MFWAETGRLNPEIDGKVPYRTHSYYSGKLYCQSGEISFPNIINLPSPTSSGDFFPFLSFKTNAAWRRRGQINNIGKAYSLWKSRFPAILGVSVNFEKSYYPWQVPWGTWPYVPVSFGSNSGAIVDFGYRPWTRPLWTSLAFSNPLEERWWWPGRYFSERPRHPRTYSVARISRTTGVEPRIVRNRSRRTRIRIGTKKPTVRV